jgi:hypothetical protein
MRLTRRLLHGDGPVGRFHRVALASGEGGFEEEEVVDLEGLGGAARTERTLFQTRAIRQSPER